MTTYAPNTRVEVHTSRGYIQADIARFGCVFDTFIDDPGRVIICFHNRVREVRFVSLLPHGGAQELRVHWRALHAGIKGKLICIATGIETFEQAFYAHLVTVSGKTVSEEALPKLKRLPALYGHNTADTH